MRDDAQDRRSRVWSRLSAGAGRVHFVGTGGVGMAGLAFLLKTSGFQVSGCDKAPGPAAAWLARQGVEVRQGHDPSHVRDADWMVRTAAVPPDSPELEAAAAAGVPVFLRGEVLAALLAQRPSVAVAGTHGKTTTSTFIALLLRACGREVSWCIGGTCSTLGGVAGAGRSPGAALVVEADESDATLALYRADIAVLTNIDVDHLEHFEGVEALEACFRSFVQQAGTLIYCADDPRAASLGREHPRAVSYGFTPGCDVRGRDVAMDRDGLEMTVFMKRRSLGRVRVPVTGTHNALNFLAACAVVLESGGDVDALLRASAAIRLPERRFEIVAERGGVRVVSDYAHHPVEISALLSMARAQGADRLVGLFQPHRFTRTRALGSEFPPAFEGLAVLVLVPVYAASEQPVKGGSVWDLYEHFRCRRATQQGELPVGDVRVAESLEQAWYFLARELRQGDLFLVIGAGDVERVGAWAADRPARAEMPEPRDAPELSHASTMRFHESLAGKTTLGVGGCADVWAEVGNVEDLRHLLAWTLERRLPFRMLGRGSNLLVSDLGVDGVTARLSGEAFRRVRASDGVVRAGAGLPLNALLQWTVERGLGGLECLAGIPASLGGALLMNAGAWGRQIGDIVSWIRCLNPDGSECIVEAPDLDFGYRCCPALEHRVVVEAGLRLRPSDLNTMRRTVAECLARRRWMSGMRCAGSVFRNPSGAFAGELVERAGLKGVRVGGAEVSGRHGNVIVTREGANASDVMALAKRMQRDVAASIGVTLELELRILGRC